MLEWPTSMLAVDEGSTDSDAAIETAAATALVTGSRLSLVHVKLLAPPLVGDQPSAGTIDRLRQEGRGLLERRVREVRERGVEVDQQLLKLGRRVEAEVERAVDELDAGLIVVAARGHSLPERHAQGDVSGPIVRAVPCAVLVVRADEEADRPRHTLRNRFRQ